MYLEAACVIFAVTLVTPSLGYPNGAPLDACLTMFPTGHSVNAQTSTPPYTITVSNMEYTLGGQIQVTVAGNGTQKFKGLFVQARLAKCSGTVNGTAQGTFALNETESELQLVTCSNTAASAVTHNSSVEKSMKTFTWNAPSTDVGTVYFRATVVQSVKVLWTQVSSDFISSPANAGNLEKCEMITTTTTAAPMVTTTMGVETIQTSLLFVVFCSAMSLLGLY